MTEPSPSTAHEALPRIARAGPGRWARWLSAAISIAILVAVLLELRKLDLGDVRALIPTNPLFWFIFALYYLAAPISEWIIYRRLWNLPVSGIAALLRKLVSNELLLGYLGEVQFYAWARARTRMTAAPFGAIKDVTILSALVGNLFTLALLAAAWPFISTTEVGMETRTVILSLAVVLVTSLAILLFRQRLFTLPRRELWWVSFVHLARIIVYLGLSAAMWALILPMVPVGWWLVLATIRMLLSRLPLLPNKDIVFAGLAAVLLGQNAPVAELMTLMAGLILAAHIVVGALAGIAEFLLRDSDDDLDAPEGATLSPPPSETLADRSPRA